jgi:hypothetical protein
MMVSVRLARGPSGVQSTNGGKLGLPSENILSVVTTVALGAQAQQDVLGAGVVVLQTPGLLLGQHPDELAR